jgi:hypothetical protein
MVARAPISRSRPFTAAIHELAARTDAAVLLDLEGTILFANDAWERFARVGGGFGEAAVGVRLPDVVRGEEPREALRRLLAWAARGAEGRARSITVECNGPDLARLVSMQVSPVLAGAEPIGLVIVQRVVRELPAAEVYEVVEGTADQYRAGDGSLEQCCCCRRSRRPSQPDEWDFVPALVAAPPPETAFGYCPLCRELHDPFGPKDKT